MRTQGEPGDPDAYWRRRFIILGGGLAVLMLLAWMFGGGGPSRQASQTAAVRASMAARQAQGALPSAAYGSPYGAQPSASAPGSPSPSVPASPSASPSRPAAWAGKQCPSGSVVLTLLTSKPGYRPRERPAFTVYAVATSASGCQLKYGPAAVRVVVTRHGTVVWDSAACPAAHQGTRTVRLDQGVPQEVTLSWNRKASARPCAGTLASGSSGTFEAAAAADGFTSPSRSFKLLR